MMTEKRQAQGMRGCAHIGDDDFDILPVVMVTLMVMVVMVIEVVMVMVMVMVQLTCN